MKTLIKCQRTGCPNQVLHYDVPSHANRGKYCSKACSTAQRHYDNGHPTKEQLIKIIKKNYSIMSMAQIAKQYNTSRMHVSQIAAELRQANELGEPCPHKKSKPAKSATKPPKKTGRPSRAKPNTNKIDHKPKFENAKRNDDEYVGLWYAIGRYTIVRKISNCTPKELKTKTTERAKITP